MDEAARSSRVAGICPPSAQSTPPISPKNFNNIAPEQDPFEDSQESELTGEELIPATTSQEASSKPAIPQFFFPRGEPVPHDIKLSIQCKIDEMFQDCPEGMVIKEFTAVVKEVCELPLSVAYPLFEKLRTSDNTPAVIHKKDFVEWWDTKNMALIDRNSRLFEILRSENNNFIGQVGLENPLLFASDTSVLALSIKGIAFCLMTVYIAYLTMKLVHTIPRMILDLFFVQSLTHIPAWSSLPITLNSKSVTSKPLATESCTL